MTRAGPDAERGGSRYRRGRPGDRDPRRLVVAFAAVVVAASLVPVPGAASGGGQPGGLLPAWVGVTMGFHLVGYALLAALVVRAVRRAPRQRVAAAALGVAVATGVGFGVELLQAPIPWRSFAWTDAAVNAVGAVLGAAIAAASPPPGDRR
ncbi:VanZ family protein [Halorubrum sp. AD140]|uniref:VanZ family protein n=1 Tax=Halorubrum sp. AD140 TaxID=3050073 RepID=UPI002ACD1025|nr:VanZ family protein [Halorubrum sp. AD140]MDZ5813331.1 VanZ family protein [Halorubrum sp. AD140]